MKKLNNIMIGISKRKYFFLHSLQSKYQRFFEKNQTQITINLFEHFVDMKMLQRLDQEVVKRLKASWQIVDLNECVLQLIYNSLDANAKRIQIYLDYERFFIEIIDDGCGICEKDMELLGERYATNKFYSLETIDSLSTYGYHGEFLFNLINISSRLEIISKPNSNLQNDYKRKTIVYDGNKGYTKRVETFNTNLDLVVPFSTCIRVFDVFSRHPVRQTQLKISNKNLTSLLNSLEQLSLINYDIQFNLFDLYSKKALFQVTDANKSLIQRFFDIFKIPFGSYSNIKMLNFTYKSFKIHGFIYCFNRLNFLNTDLNLNQAIVLNSKYQFIYLNNFFIRNNEYYDLVTNELCSCKEFNLLNADPKQMLFVIQIKCASDQYRFYSVLKNKHLVELKCHQMDFKQLLKVAVELFLNENNFKKSHHELNKVNNQIKELIEKNEYLNKHSEYENLRLDEDDLRDARFSKIVKNFKSKKEQVTRKNAHLFNKNNLKDLLQAHVSKNTISKEKKQREYLIQSTPLLTKNKANLKDLVNETNNGYKVKFSKLKVQIKEIQANELRKKKISQKGTKQTQTDQETRIKLQKNWISHLDKDGKEFFINLYDGTTTYDLNMVISDDQRNINDEQVMQFNQLLDEFNPRSSTERATKHISIENDLKPFKKILNKLETRMSIKWRDEKEYEKNLNSQTCITVGSLDEPFSKSIKIDANLFKSLQVIGQFDKKFILAYSKKNDTNESCLLIFDQHACHERIRLEMIIKENLDEYGHVACEDLTIPLKMKVNSIDKSVIEVFKLRMKQFGFNLDLIGESNDKECQNWSIQINKIPRIFVKRFNKDDQIRTNLNSLIQNQLRNCYSSFKVGYQVPINSTINNGLSHLPVELIDTFNMEACRSSVKFGDKLEPSQCIWLLNELIKCKLPFQCAHGRPTAVPLLNIKHKHDFKSKVNLKKLRNII